MRQLLTPANAENSPIRPNFATEPERPQRAVHPDRPRRRTVRPRAAHARPSGRAAAGPSPARLEARQHDETVWVTDRGIRYILRYDIAGGVAWSVSFSGASKRVLGWSRGAHGVRHAYVQKCMQELQRLLIRTDALETVSQELGHLSARDNRGLSTLTRSGQFDAVRRQRDEAANALKAERKRRSRDRERLAAIRRNLDNAVATITRLRDSRARYRNLALRVEAALLRAPVRDDFGGLEDRLRRGLGDACFTLPDIPASSPARSTEHRPLPLKLRLVRTLGKGLNDAFPSVRTRFSR